MAAAPDPAPGPGPARPDRDAGTGRLPLRRVPRRRARRGGGDQQPDHGVAAARRGRARRPRARRARRPPPARRIRRRARRRRARRRRRPERGRSGLGLRASVRCDALPRRRHPRGTSHTPLAGASGGPGRPGGRERGGVLGLRRCGRLTGPAGRSRVLDGHRHPRRAGDVRRVRAVLGQRPADGCRPRVRPALSHPAHDDAVGLADVRQHAHPGVTPGHAGVRRRRDRGPPGPGRSGAQPQPARRGMEARRLQRGGQRGVADRLAVGALHGQLAERPLADGQGEGVDGGL